MATKYDIKTEYIFFHSNS